MAASKKTDGVLLAAASATLVGAALSQPLLALGAASLAALVGSRLRAIPATHKSAVPANFPSRTLAEDLAKPFMLRGFGSRDAASPTPTSDTTEATEGPGASGKKPGTNERGSRSYREFAAGLEEDEQEISFLPPYASDSADNAGKGTRTGPGDGSSESLLVGDLQEADEQAGKIPVARRFALGTVAIIRRLLEPQDVERILIEQRRYPRLRFGDVAVQLNLLSDSEVQELLVAQEQGIFSDEEISDARRRLSAYHTGGPT